MLCNVICAGVGVRRRESGMRGGRVERERRRGHT